MAEPPTNSGIAGREPGELSSPPVNAVPAKKVWMSPVIATAFPTPLSRM